MSLISYEPWSCLDSLFRSEKAKISHISLLHVKRIFSQIQVDIGPAGGLHFQPCSLHLPSLHLQKIIFLIKFPFTWFGYIAHKVIGVCLYILTFCLDSVSWKPEHLNYWTRCQFRVIWCFSHDQELSLFWWLLLDLHWSSFSPCS